MTQINSHLMFRLHYMHQITCSSVRNSLKWVNLYCFIVNIMRIVLFFKMKIKYLYEYCGRSPSVGARMLLDLWTCKHCSASPVLQDINQNAFIRFKIHCNQKPTAQQWLRFYKVFHSAFLNTSTRLNLLTYWTRYCESAHESSEPRLRPSVGTVINVLWYIFKKSRHPDYPGPFVHILLNRFWKFADHK